MTREEIKECLYEKYILPTERKRERFVGVEIEMPVVNLTGKKTVQKYAQKAMTENIWMLCMKGQKT